MSFEKNLFPQAGDANDATKFAQLSGHDILVDYVESGIDVSTDFPNNSATVSEGVCYISKESEVATSDGTEIRNLGFAVQVESKEFSLGSSGTEYLYVHPRFDQTDYPELELLSNEGNAQSHWLKVAKIDIDSETVEELNRNPSATVDTLLVEDELELDGSTVATLNESKNLKSDQLPDILTHDTELNRDYTVPDGSGAVLAGPISGTGTISGDGRISILGENQRIGELEGDVNGNGFNVTNLDKISGNTLETITFGADATEAIQDIVGSLVVGQNDASVTYDDANDELTVDVSTLTTEQVEDKVNNLISSGPNLSLAYDDPSDNLTVSLKPSVSVDSLETDSFGTTATESIEDIVGSLVVGQNDANVTYDDANDELSIDVSTLTTEQVEDKVESLVASGSNLSWSYDDPNDTLTVSLDDSITISTLETDSFGTTATESIEDIVGSLVVGKNDANVTYDDANDELSIDVSTLTTEQVEDKVNSLISAGSNVSTNYDDANDTLTISSSDTQLSDEQVEDKVDSLISAGSNVSTNYDDANDTLTISSSDSNSNTQLSDSEVVDAVDGEIDSAATSISGLDNTVAAKASDNHGNSSHSTNYLAQSNYNPETDSDLSNLSVSGNVNLSGFDLNNVSQISIDDQHSGGETVAFGSDGSGSVLAKMDKFQISSAGGGNANLRVNGSADIDGSLNVGNITGNTNDIIDFNDNYLNNVSQITFYWDGTIGFGWRPETGANVSDNQSIATYAGIEAGTADQTADIFAGGDIKAQGNKPFVIEHPSDNTKKLRHCAYEGPVSGGLIYRDQVEVVNGEASVDFPDYVTNGDFGADWVQSVTPKQHFGTGYLDTDTWTVKADSDGTYDVVLMGQRTDSQGLAGLGGITTKDKDESWDEAADRFYGGATDIDGNEVATDDDEYRQTTLYAHAESQHDEEQQE